MDRHLGTYPVLGLNVKDARSMGYPWLLEERRQAETSLLSKPASVLQIGRRSMLPLKLWTHLGGVLGVCVCVRLLACVHAY